MKKITINSSEIDIPVDVPTLDLPKYTSPLINNANIFSHATRPKNVGQMSNLIREFPGTTLKEWSAWYKQRHPDTIEDATDKIKEKLDKIIEAGGKIDRNLIRDWVEDLVLVKTFEGLKIQEAILRKLAELKDCDYRLAEPYEESQGIDGFVGDEAYSIKNVSYRSKPHLLENIIVPIIFYRKKTGKKADGDIEFELPEGHEIM